MPKINQEEYEVLKNLDDNKWKWIARNYNGALITYTDKPMKNPNLYWDSFGERMDDRLFQFIQWEDEDPYNISELIEEYENSAEHVSHVVNERVKALGKAWSESEEKEVKKGIEWLKREIHKELEDWHGVEGGIDGDGINEIMLLFNQLDEPEVLTSDWIKDNQLMWTSIHGAEYYVPADKLYGKIVPKQEVTIGKEDAENIVQYKEMGWTLSHLINDYGEDARHDELLAKAWLAYPNIEAEEEQKYVVELPNPNNQMGRHKNVFLNKEDGKVFIDSASLFVNDITKYGQFALTEEEIKKDFEWAWKFAKPVEELKEC